jgi:hypothetical protein
MEGSTEQEAIVELLNALAGNLRLQTEDDHIEMARLRERIAELEGESDA